MSGWEQTHRRYRLVYAVAEDIARRGADAIDEWRAAIHVEYGDLAAFLLDVRRRWYVALDAHMDDVPYSEAAVAEANRPLHVLLSAFADHPVLAEGGTWRAVANPA